MKMSSRRFDTKNPIDSTVVDVARPATFVAPSRETLQKVRSYLAQSPELYPRFERAKEFRQILRKVANIDVTSRCNLRCEGCFYFEGDDYKRAPENNDIADWQDFFHEQAREGVTFASLVGAEPALCQDRLAAANNFIPRGAIFTNGTIKIDPAIQYAIVISIWGDQAATSSFRGGDTFWKAIKTHQGDSRARALFTVHAKNINQIPHVAQIIADHGLLLSFNYFSPTTNYLTKIASNTTNDDAFFRISSKGDNLVLTSESLLRCRDTIDDVIDCYPDTVFHTHAFNHVCTDPMGLYDIDPNTGIATNCGGRNFHWHRSYRVDLNPSDSKCCTPNVDCSQCRLNAVALASLVYRLDRFLDSLTRFRDWLDICDQYGRSNLLQTDPVWSGRRSDTASLHATAREMRRSEHAHKAAS